MFPIFLIFVSLFVSNFGGLITSDDHSSDIGGKVIGGDTVTNIENFPYQAQMYDLDWPKNDCGGVILTKNIILSTASCLHGNLDDLWMVNVGNIASHTGGQKARGRSITTHHGYDYRTGDYDIALLFLQSSLELDNITAKAITLPNQDDEVLVGADGDAIGWGELEDGTRTVLLQNKTLTVISNEECTESFAQYRWLVSERMLCATNSVTGNDLGIGDYGSPLVVDGVLAGLSAWGTDYYKARAAVCPAVFTRVASYVDWIRTNAYL